MNLLGKLQNEYDQLWKLIIRPTRTPYPDSALGPETFVLENKKVKRIDFQLINPRGLVFYVSHFVPLEQESYPCLIYAHGNSSNRTEGMEYLGELIRRNISLCTFDFSGCGNAEGQYVTLGYYEWQDLHEVVQYIRHKDKVTSIGIWGRSMGAVTGLLYLKKSEYVQVGVFDSPFKSLKALIEDLCKKNSKIPLLIVQGALKIISGTIQQKADFDIYKLNPLKYEVPYLNFPAFFIVGRDDQLIPHSHTEELFHAYKGKQKDIRIVSGGHNDDRPDNCIRDAIDFLATHLKKKKPIKIISETSASKIKKTEDMLSGGNDDLLSGGDIGGRAKQVDFFAEEIQEKLEEIRQPQSTDAYTEFENMKEQDLKNIDFFASSGQGGSTEQPKVQKEKYEFSLAGVFSNMVGKAKNFNFGMTSQSKREAQKVVQKPDGFDPIRSKITANFTEEESDLQQKHKMERVQRLAKIKQQESGYGKNFLNENEGKIDSWVFV